MKITKGAKLSEFLDSVINESLGLKKSYIDQKLIEKELQVKHLKSDDGEETADFDKIKKNQQSKTIDADSAALKGNVKLDNIVDKLNMIRSGKSFKDSAVTQRFEEYFESLSDAERIALFAFLKGIAQIVTGEIEPNDAIDPSDDPASIKMKRKSQQSDDNGDVEKKSVKPNVVKAPQAPSDVKPKRSNVEDTSAPKPISPKQR